MSILKKTIVLEIETDRLPMVWHGLLNILKLATTNEEYNYTNKAADNASVVFDLLGDLLPHCEKEHAALFNLSAFTGKPLE